MLRKINKFLLLLLLVVPAEGRVRFWNYCQNGGVPIKTSSINSTNRAQGSYPGCGVSVTVTATGDPAIIYSDDNGTPKSNPFTADLTTGYYFYYADDGTYSDQISGTGFSTFTRAANSAIDPIHVPFQIRFLPALSGGSDIYSQCTTAHNAGVQLVIDSLASISTTNSCSAGVSIITGGIIQPTNGRTVTLAQNTQCPLTQQCFDVSLGGEIKFTSPPVQVSPVQWGAVSGADSTVAIQAAVNAVVPVANQGGGSVLVPCGNFKVASRISLPQNYGMDFSGSGKCTTFTWTGASASTPMFYLPSAFMMHVHDFQMTATSALLEAFEISTGVPQPISSSSYFENLYLNGNALTQYGFVIDGTNSNNDFVRMMNVRVQNLNTINSGSTCFVMKGSNSVGHMFYSPFCAQADYGFLATTADGTGSGNRASFSMSGGALSTNIADFSLQGYSIQPVHLSDFYSEDLGELLVGSGGLVGKVTISNFNWGRSDASSYSSTDFITYSGGPVTIEHARIQNNSATTSLGLTITYHYSSGINDGAIFEANDVAISNTSSLNTLALLFGSSDANPKTYVVGCNMAWVDRANILASTQYLTGASNMCGFGGSSSLPVLGVNATTWDVSSGSAFQTANTGGTTVLYMFPGENAGTPSGTCSLGSAPIQVVVKDSHTSISTAGNIQMTRSSPYSVPSGAVLLFSCMFNNQTWTLLN